ncbi:MAG: RluA family pseudouridine synthase [Alphaproteobacteria bacterium]|nr:RluA family pseudouridine synthase [Alphaproteobacteria bacterium]MDX5369554.1 RluA family pseudouridine synthase [Alphaproteobacteria bacterium]MDX5464208.1 RluA family pseudouridine synthase [Alphaproteobacteria bacterium]
MLSDIGDEHLLTVGNADAGQRLDRYITASLPHLSRSRVQRLIETGFVSVSGRAAVDASTRVGAGDEVEVVVPPPDDPLPSGEDIPLDIVHEDADLLVVNKPAGLVVHPAPGSPESTLVNALIAHCGDSLSGIGGVKRPGIVHRIDKETSGLMVVAKHDGAHLGLSEQFAAHTTERSYRAIVWGAPPVADWSPTGRRLIKGPWGRIEGAIGRSPTNRKKMAVVKSGGKTAVTHFRVLERFGPADAPVASLVECRLETGRTHQIRVHMTHIGHPLIGDGVYGGKHKTLARTLSPRIRPLVEEFPRQALHAATLGFRHPRTGEEMRFSAPLPEDMAFLLGALRNA